MYYQDSSVKLYLWVENKLNFFSKN